MSYAYRDVAKIIGKILEPVIGENVLKYGDFESINWTTDWTTVYRVYRTTVPKYEGSYSLRTDMNEYSGYLEKEFDPFIILKNIKFAGITNGTVGIGQAVITVTYEDDSTNQATFVFESNVWNLYQYTNPINKKVKKIKIELVVSSLYSYPCIDVLEINKGKGVKYDEFDPKDPQLQILLENFPAKSTWIVQGILRVEHQVRITLYKKIIRYNPDDIENYRKEWYDTKQEIDKRLAESKFNLLNDGIAFTVTGTWDDKDSIAVGRGVKTTKEPIVWKSEQRITCVYYQTFSFEAEAYGNPTSIVRPKSIDLGVSNASYTTFYGFKSITWEDVSPWIHIDIPHGNMIHQHIRSPHYRGEITTNDINMITTFLYSRTIDNNNNTLINPSTSRKYTAGYVKFTFMLQDGTTISYVVSGFKVETISLSNVELGMEALWTIRFTADNIKKV